MCVRARVSVHYIPVEWILRAFVVFGLELVAGSVISELAVQICDVLVVISCAASLLFILAVGCVVFAFPLATRGHLSSGFFRNTCSCLFGRQSFL